VVLGFVFILEKNVCTFNSTETQISPTMMPIMDASFFTVI
jgi:hypothetical protein